MFENLKKLFRINKKIDTGKQNSKNRAKERLHLVLMQDRANVSADFLDLMRKEIIEVIKKYIDIDEKAMDVRLTTETNEDGTQGAPALYANIPIINIKDETRKLSKTNQEHKIEIKLAENKNQKSDENKEQNNKNENLDETQEQKENKENEKITDTENQNNTQVQENSEEKNQEPEKNDKKENKVDDNKDIEEKTETSEHESQNKEEENNDEE